MVRIVEDDCFRRAGRREVAGPAQDRQRVHEPRRTRQQQGLMGEGRVSRLLPLGELERSEAVVVVARQRPVQVMIGVLGLDHG
jgi:hypothetical protein